MSIDKRAEAKELAKAYGIANKVKARKESEAKNNPPEPKPPVVIPGQPKRAYNKFKTQYDFT